MPAFSQFEPGFEARLAAAGFKTFDDFWNLEWKWVEPRNERRSGWSGASRVRIDTPEGPLSLFVKRQENHCYRSHRHPFRGRPTFYREWCNIQRLRAAGVPTLDPVFYGERMQQGRYQAILISLALDDFRELDLLCAPESGASAAEREAFLRAVGKVLARFHETGLKHNCMSGAHFMLHTNAAGEVDARLLDLEKMKAVRNVRAAAASDLARFIRRTPTLSVQDHASVIRTYAQSLTPEQRERLLARINAELHRNHTERGRRPYPTITLD